MIGSILSIDNEITHTINILIPHNHFFDFFFPFFSQRGSSILIWVAIILALIIFEEVKDRRFIVFFGVSFLLSVILANFVLKNIFHRPRPPITISQTMAHQTCPKDFSFPSGHATAAFAASAILSKFDKKRKYFYYLVAGLIGLSRIYLQCHYFLDVLAGTILGYSISKTLLHFLPLRNSRIR